MNESALAARIGWRCRRGMLELDAMLGPFFKENYATLVPAQRAAFAALLEEEDPDLQAWLVAGELCANPQYGELIGAIRAFRDQQRAG